MGANVGHQACYSHDLTLVGKARPEFRLAGVSPKKGGDRYQDLYHDSCNQLAPSKAARNCGASQPNKDMQPGCFFKGPALRSALCYSKANPAAASTALQTDSNEVNSMLLSSLMISAGTALAIFRMLIPYVPASETFFVASPSCRGGSGQLVLRQFDKRWQECFVYWTRCQLDQTVGKFGKIWIPLDIRFQS
ncbi:hypothetical protein AC578_3381 [Pseudocercospora eumusae]|uniref:Uncharacterized protein n=1 Tax=Pseudocercospora eumusae TaxID=321146 RepID=A0A139GV61_9PEZI|nr:hypothetical protein AC578_3381 [Pseudocercospora eumusae]